MGITNSPAAEVRNDVVVVGGGLAGLTAALSLAPLSVALLTKTRLGRGGASAWAQGGMAAAVGPEDSPALHAQDTLAAAAGLADPLAVDVLTREAADRVGWLQDLGARFDRDGRGFLDLGREAAHSRRRILHAGGDATGAELMRALSEAVLASAHIRCYEGVQAWELARAAGRVTGLLVLGESGWSTIRASAVVLATGGIGRLYSHTTNPPESTGDGLALAARAGAVLADLEFVQFHPTALDAGRDPLPLLTEALRGEGAVLIDERGHRFMPAHHPLAELAPRDVVARAIWEEMEDGRRVFLDARRLPGRELPARFPTVFSACRNYGLDPLKEPLPIVPAAHHHMGGVAVDLQGRSSLLGLWACGEVASTGTHGANRLASNSLLEAVVWGRRVAEDIRRQWSARIDREVPSTGSDPQILEARLLEPGPLNELRSLFWDRVGLVRDESGLMEALARLKALGEGEEAFSLETRNLLLSGRIIAQAALQRRESRGCHFRRDFPQDVPEEAHRRFYRFDASRDALEPSPSFGPAPVSEPVRQGVG